jgi:serine/threonine protein phosphatase 1
MVERDLVVIGDVHGCYDTLVALIEKCPKDDQFCFVGDLIDRGPHSSRVVDLIMEQGWLCVMGNHEKMALESGIRRSQYTLWMWNGGEATRASYHTDPSYRSAPQKWLDHLRWMASLPSYIEFKDLRRDDGRHLLVCHAGFSRSSDGSLETAKQEQVVNDEVLWHRGDVIHDYQEVFQVIGHTPTAEGPQIETHFANIDTGAFYNSEPFGVLTALQFPETRIITQPNIDRMEAC